VVRIRLQRMGRRNKALFRVVVTDIRIKRQGGCLERIGQYDPAGKDENKVLMNLERVKHWVSKGAQVSDTVKKLMKNAKPFPAVAAAATPAPAKS